MLAAAHASGPKAMNSSSVSTDLSAQRRTFESVTGWSTLDGFRCIHRHGPNTDFVGMREVALAQFQSMARRDKQESSHPVKWPTLTANLHAVCYCDVEAQIR